MNVVELPEIGGQLLEGELGFDPKLGWYVEDSLQEKRVYLKTLLEPLDGAFVRLTIISKEQLDKLQALVEAQSQILNH